MVNKTSIKILAVIISIGIAFAWGRYSAPKNVETKEVVKKEIEYITREVKKPDGTIIKEVIQKDLTEKAKDNKTVYEKPKYKAEIIPKYNFETKKTTYGASVSKRFSGPIFVGVYGDTDKNVGVSLGIEF